MKADRNSGKEKHMKMKCSVIQDLLPSYADNICSDDTRELVEEHVAECVQCKEKLEHMKNTEIVAGKASKKQVDYLKKIRSTITHKEELGKLMLVLLVGIAYVGLFVGGGGLLDYPRIPSVVFSILIFCAAVLAGNYRYSGGKAAWAEILVSGVVFVFMVAFFAHLVVSVTEYEASDAETMLFLGSRMKPMQVGPICANICRAAALPPAAVLLWNTFGKRKNAYATTLNITAVSHIVYVNDWLYHMDSAEMSMGFMKELNVTQIVLTVVGIVIFALLQKFGKAPGGERIRG